MHRLIRQVVVDDKGHLLDIENMSQQIVVGRLAGHTVSQQIVVDGKGDLLAAHPYHEPAGQW